jgi:dTDP-4-dehydrorhamnose reductase
VAALAGEACGPAAEAAGLVHDLGRVAVPNTIWDKPGPLTRDERDRPYREDDETSPINAYGLTKFRGEQELSASGARALIIRTQWLFGRAGRSFPRTMWERATKGLTTRVVNDQTGRPTYSRDLAEWTWKLVAQQAEGIFHAANAGTATWFDVASRVFDRVGLDYLVTPSTTVDNPTPARRPAYSVLDTTKLEQAVGLLRSWQDALDEFMAEIERAP